MIAPCRVRKDQMGTGLPAYVPRRVVVTGAPLRHGKVPRAALESRVLPSVGWADHNMVCSQTAVPTYEPYRLMRDR